MMIVTIMIMIIVTIITRTITKTTTIQSVYFLREVIGVLLFGNIAYNVGRLNDEYLTTIKSI